MKKAIYSSIIIIMLLFSVFNINTGFTNDQNIDKDKIVVYYFHGNVRCATCKTIESLTKASLSYLFHKQLEDGSIEFKAVNVEEDENEHFVTDYQLITRSVVLSKISNKQETEWKRLDKVWQYVRDDEKFVNYINDSFTELNKGDN